MSRCVKERESQRGEKTEEERSEGGKENQNNSNIKTIMVWESNINLIRFLIHEALCCSPICKETDL